ncbi:T9SS type A sorting domain-containing protein [Seonamhaeicola sp. NFXS20]|uniref:T9SS type A sorting domain-containing protein n=2 Tax=unclassified Seonamhaeicola TaxID=2622645 RepID=UPI003B8C43C1
MKKIYFLSILSILSISKIHAQTVTVDDHTPNATATYTFTFTTDRALGYGSLSEAGANQGVLTDIFVISSTPSGFPSFTSVDSPNNITDAIIKIDGVVQDNSDFYRIVSYFGFGIYIGTETIAIPAGSTIEVIIPNLIVNPSTEAEYEFNWRTSTAHGFDAVIFTASINVSTLSTDVVKVNNINKYVYPNPSTNFIQISGITESQNYKIYNTLGSEVISGTLSQDKEINIKELTKGLYFIELEDRSSFKFIKN